MNATRKTTLIIAFVVVVALFLLFGGGAMTGTMMSSGMMGSGSMGGINWMWIPTLLTLGLGGLESTRPNCVATGSYRSFSQWGRRGTGGRR